jgi:hypothetical protein
MSEDLPTVLVIVDTEELSLVLGMAAALLAYGAVHALV